MCKDLKWVLKLQTQQQQQQMSCTHKHSKGCCKGKRGGPRKILTWQEKLALAEKETVRRFLGKTTCGCAEQCMQKIVSMGDAGVSMVCNLRDARLAGKSDIKILTLLHFFFFFFTTHQSFPHLSYPG